MKAKPSAQSAAQTKMVDVGDKPPTARRAVAGGWIRMNAGAMEAITTGKVPKGDVITTATLAGIQAAKRTPETLPLCHPLGEISGIDVKITPQPASNLVEISAEVRAFARTGVEMEALCAVAAAALCVYDMCKSLDRAMEIGGLRLLEKHGGKSGK